MPLPSDRGADAASLPPAVGPSRRAGRQRHLVAAGGEPSSRFGAGAWRGRASAPAPPSPRETPPLEHRPRRGSVETWGWRRPHFIVRILPLPAPTLRTGSPGILLGRCGSVPARCLPAFASVGPFSVLGFVTQDAGPRARRTFLVILEKGPGSRLPWPVCPNHLLCPCRAHGAGGGVSSGDLLCSRGLDS